jgi:peptide/nickel transport system permease protein
MAYFVVKRLGQLLVVMWACSVILFLLTAWSPSRVEYNILGQFAVEAQYKILRKTLRLDDPVLIRYGRWMGQISGLAPHPLTDPELNAAIAAVEDLRGRGAGARTDLGLEDQRGEQYFLNFGYSMQTREPVNNFVWNRLGNTAMLAGFAFMIIVPVSLLIGVFAGMRPQPVHDGRRYHVDAGVCHGRIPVGHIRLYAAVATGNQHTGRFQSILTDRSVDTAGVGADPL